MFQLHRREFIFLFIAYNKMTKSESQEIRLISNKRSRITVLRN